MFRSKTDNVYRMRRGWLRSHWHRGDHGFLINAISVLGIPEMGIGTNRGGIFFFDLPAIYAGYYGRYGIIIGVDSGKITSVGTNLSCQVLDKWPTWKRTGFESLGLTPNWRCNGRPVGRALSYS